MSKEHNIMTEWADVFECSCGFAYEGENRVEVERAHLYVNKFVDDCNEAELREQIAKEIEGLICTTSHLTPDVIAGCQVERYSYRRAARTARGK